MNRNLHKRRKAADKVNSLIDRDTGCAVDLCAPATPELDTLLPSIICDLKEIVFRTDSEGRLTFLNPAWEEVTGFRVADSLGKSFLHYVHPDDRAGYLECFRALIDRKKDHCQQEFRYLRKDGGFRWVEMYSRLAFDTLEGDASTCGTLTDVSQKRAVLEDLKATQRRLQYLLDSGPAVIFTANPSSNFGLTWISENIASLLGTPARLFIEDPYLWLERVHAEDASLMAAFLRRQNYPLGEGQEQTQPAGTSAGQPSGTIEARYRCDSGNYRWLRLEMKIVREPGGLPVEALGCLLDVTETMEALDSLKRREAILEAISFVAERFLHGEDWEAEIPAAIGRLGAAASADLVCVTERVLGPDGESMIRLRHNWATGSEAVPLRGSGLGPDLMPGVPRWERLLDRNETLVAIVKDLPESERVIVEADGFRSIAFVPIFVGSSRWGVIGFARRCDLSWAAATIDGLRTAARIIGAAIQQSQSRQTLRLAHEELESRVRERTRELASSNRALRESEQLYRTLVETSPDAIILCGLDYRVRMANRRCAELFGFEKPEELVGSEVSGWVYDEDKAVVNRALQDLMSRGRIQELEARLLRPDGSRFVAEVSASVVFDSQGRPRHVICVVRDVTERSQLEEQFRQAQKMEAIGRLAGGVAHDFNNLLTVIKGYGELLVKRLNGDPGNFRKVSQILNAADRAAGLVSQLLAFSRKQMREPKIVDVNEALTNTASMLRRLIGEDIRLSMFLDSDAGSIRVDPGQFDQLVMNLAVNARDAMEVGGELEISTHRVIVSDRPSSGTVKLAPGRYILIQFKDNGIGMTEEIRSRIFEPFFTTKEVGRGTGLGLSTVYGIVQQSHGHIAVESTPGEGSVFRINLPVISEMPVAEEVQAPAATAYPGHETVLVAEDEDSLRDIIVEALEDCGYTVLEAHDGQDALEVAARKGSKIDLLLTDVIMPRLGGPELYAELASHFPAMKVLFISGYTERDLQSNHNFLQKPFSPDILAQTVRNVLESPVN